MSQYRDFRGQTRTEFCNWDIVTTKQVVHKVPADSAITSGMQKMGNKERAGSKKLMDMTYFIALKGRPFTNFKDHIDLEKLQV